VGTSRFSRMPERHREPLKFAFGVPNSFTVTRPLWQNPFADTPMGQQESQPLTASDIRASTKFPLGTCYIRSLDPQMD